MFFRLHPNVDLKCAGLELYRALTQREKSCSRVQAWMCEHILTRKCAEEAHTPRKVHTRARAQTHRLLLRAGTQRCCRFLDRGRSMLVCKNNTQSREETWCQQVSLQQRQQQRTPPPPPHRYNNYFSSGQSLHPPHCHLRQDSRIIHALPVTDGCTAVHSQVGVSACLEVDLNDVQHHDKLTEQNNAIALNERKKVKKHRTLNDTIVHTHTR